MDLNLVTGQPGASKTLNTIKMVEERRLKESRPVYYANIKGLKLDWIEMDSVDDLASDSSLITPHSWFNAPEGSIIVIDECQDFFPPKSANAKQEEYIMRMAKFRHLGYSMYLITQSPQLINRNIREWVQPHIHYRRLFGGKSSYQYTNEATIDNIRNLKGLALNATIKKVKLDESYFDKYESAVMHTENKRFNKRILAYMIIPFILLPFCFYGIYNWMQSSKSLSEPDLIDSNQAEQHQEKDTKSLSQRFTYNQKESFNPMVAYMPRIEAMPETAPAYDDLRKPKTFPKPQCVHNPANDVCKCYTQQATLMHDYPKELCIDYVKNGRFDPTYIRVSHRQEGSSRHNQPIARQDSQPVKYENRPQESKIIQAYDFSSM